ncbi:hypothetical protein BOTBODRAFT_67568 [Botryobasidium botryosum FD-172 SS1]|uniref:PUM-HD domain-containing protein n=1 Tax=Botryobasidium botryosum (strain FD-172 SS1) TaxID=930990 RepID=A0A067MLE4_BOTB1|nr:hypothetical protein BOTBODRAFT_67568 [Botryobasidium botryosum FD-172 SS1]
MSSSLAPASPDPAFYPKASGKTPPPAPSAVYAKRAREIQAEERLGGARYRPPALRALSGLAGDASSVNVSSPVEEEASPLSPTNYPPGFRRARAGTLPSNMQLAAQRYASTLSSTPTPQNEFAGESSNIPAPATPAAPVRPAMRHATTVATTERNNRLRSGSLTLPSAGLSNAFGSSLFSSSWLGNASRGGSFPILDEMRSITSNESTMDDYDVHTLDYLGLDDSPVSRGPPPATVSELRNQAQAAIAGRLRANTVSNPYRRANAASMLAPTSLDRADLVEQPEDYGAQNNAFSQLDNYNSTISAGPGNNDMYYPNQGSFIAKGFKQSQHLDIPISRPRAISVGNLDRAAPQRRPADASAVRNLSYIPDISTANAGLLAQPSNGYSTANLASVPSSILRSHHAEPSKSGSSTPVSARYASTPPSGRTGNGDAPRMSNHLSAPQRDQRSVSPKGSEAQIQTPSRSLWIGNLDPTMTGEDLAHVFAPYGAIESFRLLPEKECGFINFVDTNDAIRAKDDVLNRLGGNIGMGNGQTVRIGFGKADSAPATPPSGAATNSGTTSGPFSATSGSAGSALGGSNNGQSTAGAGGMDAQLQSTPTRALWIGSIPSTTTPATILSVFSPYGPIESARVLTHKNCGFINFERLDDAVRARKALNGRDVLGSEVGAIRIGFAKVPVKNGTPGADGGVDEGMGIGVQGVGDLSVGATIHALRSIKGATAVPADQQVLGGAVENYRSNLLLSMIGSGAHQAALANDGMPRSAGFAPSVTEQQMIMKELSAGSPDAEADIQALAEFRPPTMYYTTIPLVAERAHNRRWDASKLRELRKRLDSGACSTDEIDEVAKDFLDGEIVDLASDWLGNTVVQKLFEKCSPVPRLAMLERIAPHLAMIGIHKNGTWAAQKIIECATSPEEVALISQHLRPYAPPLLLDQFGNYVIQCCLRFGPPANEFIFDAMTDRLWEVAQGRFGARSMRACLESNWVSLSQQRRIATAVILNSIPLATNPNGALLLTWLLDSSGFPSRYRLLAPRFTPHLSHLCTHKLASLTVLRIINQKVEPEASSQIVQALFYSPGDHVLTDVLGDQVNGVAVVHKVLQSPFLDPMEKASFLEATKRVLIDLKVTATQAYRRLIEEVGLPAPNFQASHGASGAFGMPGMPSGGYNMGGEPSLASMMASMQAMQLGNSGHPGMSGGLNVPPAGPPSLSLTIGSNNPVGSASPPAFSPTMDPFNPFSLRSPDVPGSRNGNRRSPGGTSPIMNNQQNQLPGGMYGGQAQTGNNLMGMGQPPFGMPPNLYQAYMYQMFQQGTQNAGTFHA